MGGDDYQITAMIVWSRQIRTDGGCEMGLLADIRTSVVRKLPIVGIPALVVALCLCALPALAQLHPGDTVAIIVYTHPD